METLDYAIEWNVLAAFDRKEYIAKYKELLGYEYPKVKNPIKRENQFLKARKKY